MPTKRTASGAGITAIAAVAALLTTGTPALATPAGPGVSGVILSQRTVHGTDYILREITIPPGQATGWHSHLGPLYGRVKQGTLSHFDATCESDGVYPQGSVIQEPAGADNVHIGVNHGDVPIILDVLYVLPAGSALSVDAPNPGCDFQ
ncbi:cupin domain-containing protein [Actinoplanes sp. NBRC 101535]|uniref:cupin domain-containing protein n=1 Tax=Actinoplanes sp. NBRC 101535 TaxID=3032196 RepID=UPI0024A0CF68|nr:cupin domain-containing protein [Actinoplanes sp. NBRC 101535]GLY02413.1 cupin [Actinoplanes sp. NBRC 101535]